MAAYLRRAVTTDGARTIHECPYTHAHTRHWCGYATCRES